MLTSHIEVWFSLWFDFMLIARQSDPDHGLILRAHLTDAGQSLVITAQQRMSVVEQRMLAPLDQAQRQALVVLYYAE